MAEAMEEISDFSFARLVDAGEGFEPPRRRVDVLGEAGGETLSRPVEKPKDGGFGDVGLASGDI